MSPEQFVAYLEEVEQDVEQASFAVPLRQCAERIQLGFAENIGLAQDEDGVQWPPHAPATVAMYGPHPLLILTGDLYDAVSVEGAKGNITRVEDRELAVGVDVQTIEYAAVHQHGAGNVPQRQYVYAREDVLAEVEEILAGAAEVIVFG